MYKICMFLISHCNLNVLLYCSFTVHIILNTFFQVNPCEYTLFHNRNIYYNPTYCLESFNLAFSRTAVEESCAYENKQCMTESCIYQIITVVIVILKFHYYE